MSSRCSVCSHSERDAVDVDLVEGVSTRKVAAKYGLKQNAVSLHGRQHLPESLPRAALAPVEHKAELMPERPAVNLAARMEEMRAATRGVLLDAQAEGMHVLVLAAVARLERQWELEAKHAEQMAPPGSTTVNITLSPDWAALRGVILRALDSHPEARVSVASALAEEASRVVH